MYTEYQDPDGKALEKVTTSLYPTDVNIENCMKPLVSNNISVNTNSVSEKLHYLVRSEFEIFSFSLKIFHFHPQRKLTTGQLESNFLLQQCILVPP